MKKIAILVVFFAVAFSCSKRTGLPDDIPTCILQKIDQLESEAVRNPPASIWQYEYNGQTVYYEPSYCCDFYSTLYDSKCNIICHPDGGIAGGGDGKCTDFFATRKNEKLIWQDNR